MWLYIKHIKKTKTTFNAISDTNNNVYNNWSFEYIVIAVIEFINLLWFLVRQSKCNTIVSYSV